MNSTQIKECIKKGELITPSYIFDMEVLTKHVNKMKSIIGEAVGLCYAMKANPFLVPIMANLVDKIEVCSPGELAICQMYGIPGNKIIFSGVNKTRQDVEAALSYNVAVITAESNKHYKLICEFCERHHTTANVLFRVTNGSQFGMDIENVERILAEKYDYIHVEGIHYFSGTQKKKFEKIECELQELDALMEHIQSTYRLTDLTLEYGAGLPVPYYEGEDFESLYQPLEMIMDVINSKQFGYKVILELGRFFAFSCGMYLTSVEEVKHNKGANYVLVDGGIHQLNYYGLNMAMRAPQMDLISINPNEVEIQREDIDCAICGSLCTMSDVLVRKWKGAMPCEGDVFVFYNAGSYSVTEAPALFLSRRMPGVYAYTEQKGLEVIRERKESYFFNC